MKKRAWILFVFFLFIAIAIHAQSSNPADTLVPNIDTTTLNDIGTDSDSAILPNQGFSLNTLTRGLLGLFSLVMIAFIFSVIGVLLFDTYKDVNWKEVFNA